MRTRSKIKRQKILLRLPRRPSGIGLEGPPWMKIRALSAVQPRSTTTSRQKDELFSRWSSARLKGIRSNPASLDQQPQPVPALSTFGEGLLSSIYSPCAIEVHV